MGACFLYGNGGSALNFRVVGGAAEPASPSENTIWIHTDTAITAWVFSAEEPEIPVEGMVWIATGTESVVEFNALKKNCVQVCPIGAKQYISGAWIDKTAKSYQGGAWVDVVEPSTPVYPGYTFSSYSSAKVSVTADNILTISNASSESHGYSGSENTIDVTEFSTIEVTYATTSENQNNAFGIKTSKPTSSSAFNSSAAKVSIPATGSPGLFQTLSIDVSQITGAMYFCFKIYGTLYVKQITMRV